MKRAARELGVATPAFPFAFTEADVEEAARTLTFPLDREALRQLRQPRMTGPVAGRDPDESSASRRARC